jgi:ferredoxin
VAPGKPAEGAGDAAGAASPRAPTLFDRADQLAWRVPTSCKRTGRCHECVVEVTAGAEQLSAPTEAERFLRPPFRLACQAALADAQADVRFAVVRRRLQIVEPEPYARSCPLDPMVSERDGVIRLGEEPIAPARPSQLATDVLTGADRNCKAFLRASRACELEVAA